MWLEWAIALQQRQDELFWDERDGAPIAILSAGALFLSGYTLGTQRSLTPGTSWATTPTITT